jgi:hypothetical protein
MSIEFNISEKNVVISDFKIGSIIEYNNNGEWIPAEIIKIHNTYENELHCNLKKNYTLPYYTILFPNKNASSDIIRNTCNCGSLLPQRIIQTNHSKIRKKTENSNLLYSLFSLFH